MKRIAILGSTGSIGTSTLEVVRELAGEFAVAGLSCHSRWQAASAQATEFNANWLVCTGKADNGHVENGANGFAGLDSALPGCQIEYGLDRLVPRVQSDDVDIVVAAIMGSAGLESTLAAIDCGKRIALANKEPLVMAGAMVMERAGQANAEIIPVDSEHSAIFQALAAGRRDEVSRLVLTASGGPFRNYTRQQLEQVTVEDALSHPTWSMGRKISVDSATLMNKALEIIEARWLFDIPPEQISVLVHPQSIVHSMVEFVDGSVISQAGPPDMKLPIQYALTYPRRLAGPANRTDWNAEWVHEFYQPDFDRFPALKLGFEVARRGGTTGCVLSAANEAAVDAFLQGKIRFNEIVSACSEILEHHHFEPKPSLTTLVKLDHWARQEIDKWIFA